MSEVYEYSVGRSNDCHLTLKNPFVSREHAKVRWNASEGWVLQDLKSSNGTFVNDPRKPMPRGSAQPLREGDIIYFSQKYKLTVALLIKRLVEGSGQESDGEMSVFEPSEGVIRIGRSSENNIVLTQLTVSRFHAEIHIAADGSRILKDLGSKIGTFVNDEQVIGRSVPITQDDRIEVGGIALCIQFTTKPGGKTSVGRQREGFFLTASRVTQTVKDRQTGAPKNLLSDISLSVYPGEFVGLMGPSGCGKTTFMTALNGSQSFSSGFVYYNGLDLVGNLSRFSPQIGYVPQDDIMHPELTVREVLFYTARLKLSGEVSSEDLHRKITEVCSDLGLKEKLDTLIGTPEQKTLSGGQKKRVNLAMELLTDPKILFLDEPTSGLSSADTVTVMKLLRKMADERGIAIVITIHQPSTPVYQLMDKVIYLKDGLLCYYGKSFPDSISYFVPDKDPEIAGPDAVMETLDRAPPQEMQVGYRRTQAYQDLVVERDNRLSRANANASSGSSDSRQANRFSQLASLLKRYLTCKVRDRASLGILFAQAPMIGLLVGWIFRESDLNSPLFLLVFVSLWFGTNNSAKELVGERSIFLREKRSGLSPVAYLFSKLLVQTGLTLIQCFLLVGASCLLIDSSFPFFSAVFICWITSLVGTSAGLCVSAWSKTEVTAIVAVPLILIPFILFGGLLKPYDDMGSLSRFAAFFNPARWGYECIVQVERDKHEKYSPSPKKVIKQLRDALDATRNGSPPPPLEEEQDEPKLLPFSEKNDLKEGNKGSGYRNGRKTISQIILSLMSIIVTSACYYRIRTTR